MTIDGDAANVDLSFVEDEATIILPEKDMIFDTLDELFGFYKKYATQVGFGVVKRRSSKDDNGDVKYVTIACSRSENRPSKSQNCLNPHPASKIKCQARINAVLIDGGSWRLSGLDLNHNHLLSPSKLHFHRSKRTITPDVQRRIELNDKAGIGINRTFNALAVEFGGHENLTFLEKDCCNYVDKVRALTW